MMTCRQICKAHGYKIRCRIKEMTVFGSSHTPHDKPVLYGIPGSVDDTQRYTTSSLSCWGSNSPNAWIERLVRGSGHPCTVYTPVHRWHTRVRTSKLHRPSAPAPPEAAPDAVGVAAALLVLVAVLSLAIGTLLSLVRRLLYCFSSATDTEGCTLLKARPK